MPKSAFERFGMLATHRAFCGKPPKRGATEPFPCRPSAVYAKQVCGLAARLKAIGCRHVVLGLSGGLDSTLALLVCVGAFERLGLDKAGIHVYTMPGFGTSKRTKGNAELLCAGLGLALGTIPIAKSVRQHLKDIGHDGATPDVTYENAQARMRTLILMDKANMTGGIVIGTGDLSEIALGWCTYNGDHMSMFAVNSNVPKTVVRKVCAWWAREGRAPARPPRTGRNPSCPDKAAEAVRDIIATPVSPELVKGQVTEDRIGPYELHDFFLWNFIVNEMGPKRLAAEARRWFGDRFAPEVIVRTLDTFLRRFVTQAFKRNCAPDGIRIFPFELSLRGWWIPSDLNVRSVLSRLRSVAAIGFCLLAWLATAGGVTVDRAAHAVTFTAAATGIGDAEPIEFLFVSPASDRAYEALYVTEASVAELARAFDEAGIPRGRPLDAPGCRFRPCGPRLTIEPPLDELLREKERSRVALPLVWTGGTRDAKGLPLGETNMPASVVALFDCPDSLMTLDDALPQSDVYGRYTARAQFKKGERRRFTVRWDGAPAMDARRVVFRSGALKSELEKLRGASAPIDLLAAFDPQLTLGEAKAVASALAVLDSRAVRVNGFVPGQFFYRAYLPLEQWRDRKERLVQPLEVRVGAGGTAAFTIVEEDWKVEGNDPKLTPRPATAAAAAAFKGDTCFFFASAGTKVGELYRVRATLPRNIRNWYVYADGNGGAP